METSQLSMKKDHIKKKKSINQSGQKKGEKIKK